MSEMKHLKIDDEADPLHPRQLIPSLLRQFYTLGWVTGTGGGISIRNGDHIYIAPSGVQKERVQSDELFVIDVDGRDVSVPSQPSLKRSQCTPLFMLAYTIRNAGAVIHTHSKWASLITQLVPGDTFSISHQEMIKGASGLSKKRRYSISYINFQQMIQNQTAGVKKDDGSNGMYEYDQTLTLPIIRNTPREAHLESYMKDAMIAHPAACAVLVRRHGLYVWGDTWQQAKSICECLDYLFEIACELIKYGKPLVINTAEDN